jgi:maltooligosyltrehalose trehalohydrolase
MTIATKRIGGGDVTAETARRCGAIALRGGGTLVRVWAPKAKRVDLVLIDDDGHRRTLAMEDAGGGFFRAVDRTMQEGQRYAFRLNGGDERQDPCSLWQPDGVPGPSAFVQPELFSWSDASWTGVARQDLVIYELHVGTFTPQGTLDAMIPRLAALRELGITAIEIMPVAQFPGPRNWGYDGVLPYATQNTYGGPHGLQRLVNAAHQAGLAVILDVVYNHLGPEANFVSEFGPYFTEKYKTPWGPALNYDDRGCDAVRDWVLDNARMWLEEFHLDGLRLDAVHSIYDQGARHILRAIKEVAEDVQARSGRQTHIIGESDLNDPKIVLAPERGGHGLDLQWSDDFHHAAHAFLTDERRGYYADFGEAEHLARALQSPFIYAWTYSAHRGRKHGAPVPAELTGDRFVVCIQNHDQVGNRARGDRLTTLLSHPAKQRLAAALLLFAPHVPLIFMGEEYGETNPFPFFCSFGGEQMIEAVRQGREAEFADFIAAEGDVPDPFAQQTFESAKLSWSWPEGSPQWRIRNLYRDLLSARTRWQALRDYRHRTARLLPSVADPQVIELIRGGGAEDGNTLRIYFNLTQDEAPLPALDRDASAVLFSSELARYGGERRDLRDITTLAAFECVAVGPANWGSLE